jgi:negative regulator of sigma E activity
MRSLSEASYARAMLDPRSSRRLDEASRAARAAEASGEDATAGEAWRRYRLIRDAARDPDELLAEGIALSRSAIELAAPGRTPR